MVRARDPAVLALPPKAPGLLTRTRFQELTVACRSAITNRRQPTGERGYYNVPVRPLEKAGLLRSLRSEVFTAKPGAHKNPVPKQRVKRPRAQPVPLCHVSASNAGYLCVPRHVGRALFGAPDADRRADGDPLPAAARVFAGVLRPHQAQACARVLDTLRSAGGGATLVASCGTGKTVMAISVVCTLGRKAAVVVHKDFLLSQWRERLALFAPGARVGVVQGDRCEVEGFDVVLCMVHSLVQRAGSGAYPLGAFGLVVFDETHHMAARTFSRAAGLFPARCRLGLTATPDRADGLGYAVEWIVGPVVCEVRRRVARARLSVIRRGKAARYKNVFDRCGNLSFAGMVTQLVEDDARNREVAALVSRMARKPGRCVLVASGRRAHLARLQELVDALLEGSGVRTGQYVGETTKGGKAAREANGEECGVLFTTFGMGEEGLDIPRMNTLVLASPKREVEQLVGRITRKRHGEGGGPEPLVCDIVDKHPLFARMHRRRAEFYRRSGMLAPKTKPQQTLKTCMKLSSLFLTK